MYLFELYDDARTCQSQKTFVCIYQKLISFVLSYQHTETRFRRYLKSITQFTRSYPISKKLDSFNLRSILFRTPFVRIYLTSRTLFTFRLVPSFVPKTYNFYSILSVSFGGNTKRCGLTTNVTRHKGTSGCRFAATARSFRYKDSIVTSALDGPNICNYILSTSRINWRLCLSGHKQCGRQPSWQEIIRQEDGVGIQSNAPLSKSHSRSYFGSRV